MSTHETLKSPPIQAKRPNAAQSRELPLIGLAKNALAARRQAQDTDRANLGR